MGTTTEKICSNKKCRHQGQPQPMAAFYKNKKRPDGHDYYCMDCRKGNLLDTPTEKAKTPISNTATIKWVIDKDIPLPPVTFIRTPRLPLPFDRMKPGHSVLVGADLILKNYKHRGAFRNSVVKQARSRGYKAATRQVGKNVRVWLIGATS